MHGCSSDNSWQASDLYKTDKTSLLLCALSSLKWGNGGPLHYTLQPFWNYPNYGLQKRKNMVPLLKKHEFHSNRESSKNKTPILSIRDKKADCVHERSEIVF